mgnify:CR=1 FL=1
MKKFIALVMALVMMASCFAGCTSTANDSDLAYIQQKGKLIVGITDYAPMDYKDENGEWTGFDAEFARLFAAELGVEVEFVEIDWDNKVFEVQSGAIDCVWNGMTITEDRLLEVDFSISYANGVQAIIVPENSPITCADDLYAEGANYKVGVQLGTTGDIYATGDFGGDNVTTYSNGNEAVLALLGGSVDCVIIDNEPAKALVAANAGLKILDTAYANEDYAICVKKGNADLLGKIDAAIMELTEDGTIAAIVAKYIK